MLFSLSAVTLSLCLRAMVGGSGGQLEEWQPLPGSALTVPIWCAATESYVSHLPRPPSFSLSLSSYLPQKKLRVLMVFWCKPWRGKMVFPLLLPASPSATGAAPPPAACLSQRAAKLAREEALASANYVLIIGNVLANQGLELPLSALRKGGVCVLRWIEEERRTERGSENRPSKRWAKSQMLRGENGGVPCAVCWEWGFEYWATERQEISPEALCCEIETTAIQSELCHTEADIEDSWLPRWHCNMYWCVAHKILSSLFFINLILNIH